jgi:uncharacterized protein (TIGR03437 family)
MRSLIAVLVLLPCAGMGQLIHLDSHTNGHGARSAASYMPPSLPGGGIAQGSLFSLFGTALGPAAGVSVTAFPLQTTFNGVSISVSQGATTVAAIPVYVSATQINLLMPSNAPLGRVSIQVSYNSQTSNPVPAIVVASSFGIFAVDGGGTGPGIFTDFVNVSSSPVNSLTGAAAPGQVVTIWGTGLGPVPVDNVAPSAGNLAAPTEVFVGGISATVAYHGRSPCCSGLDQVAFTVPANAPLGCYVPVVVRTNGTTVSNSTTMAIAAQQGGTCSDSFNPQEQSILAGKSIGVVTLNRLDITGGLAATGVVETISDYVSAGMFQPTLSPYFFNPLMALPPQGTCTTFEADYDILGTLTFPGQAAGGQLLDAGAQLTVSGSGMTVPASMAPQAYGSLLGGNNTAYFSNPLVFNPPAAVSVSAPGGTNVGPFNVNIPTGGSLQWTNQSSLQTVVRAQPLTVNWTAGGAANATVVVAGGNFDLPNSASGVFVCSAPASAGTLTIPAWAMANVPASGQNATIPNGTLMLGLEPLGAAASFTANGLGAGFGMYIPWIGKSVAWQ